jgi:IS30 family transposase
MQRSCKAYRPRRKLLPGCERFERFVHMLRERLSPEQIAGKLRSMNIPNLRDAYVCREAIYNAIYPLPVGEPRKELIICLRQGETTCRPRSGGVNRRGLIPKIVSIHVRPTEIKDRLMPGHREGDLIKGKASASVESALAERTSGYLLLIKMNDAVGRLQPGPQSHAAGDAQAHDLRPRSGDGETRGDHPEDWRGDLLL